MKPETRNRTTGVFNYLMVFFFLVLIVRVITGGFVFRLLGVTITVSDILPPILIIAFLWAAKKAIGWFSGKSPSADFRRGLVFIGAVSILLLLNFVLSGWIAGGRGGFLPDISHADTRNPDGKPPRGSWNVILISIDTLRPDHLGIYGYHRNTSPHIDALAGEGLLFENHIATGPSTLISHASILTSLYPSAHRAEFSTYAPLNPAVLTLPEVLKMYQYQTAAFTGSGQMNHIYGLDQGFDTYNDRGGKFTRTLNRSLAWLRAHGQRPFFLFIHSYVTHHPYTPPAPYHRMFYPEYPGKLGSRIGISLLQRINQGQLEVSDEDRRHIVAMYDGEIAYMDNRMGWFFQQLKKMGLWDRTLIVFTSDHGEEFNEHGMMGWHSHTLYDELLKTPLILRFPSGSPAGRRIADQTRGVDLFPTLLDLMEIEIPDGLQGVSLTPLMVRPDTSLELTAFSERESYGRPYKMEKSLRYGDYKFILSTPDRRPAGGMERFFQNLHISPLDSSVRAREFYHLAADPGESRNLFQRQKRLGREFEQRIWEMTRLNLQVLGELEADRITIDEELEKRLRSLGYID